MLLVVRLLIQVGSDLLIPDLTLLPPERYPLRWVDFFWQSGMD